LNDPSSRDNKYNTTNSSSKTNTRGGSRNQRKGGPENFVLRENLQDRMQIQFVYILFPKNYALRSKDIFENKKN
jgi:hypothetical protein